MKYRKKPIVIEATQWFKLGDHKSVVPFGGTGAGTCANCVAPLPKHGWISTLEGGHIVCPGDWVITGVKGEHYPCKPGIFAETYEVAP